MKQTILEGLHTWGVYQADRHIDFNGFFWTRPEGNLLIDPMGLDADRISFVEEQGGVRWILLSNADHLRAAPELKERFAARILGPEPDRERFGAAGAQIDHWFDSADDFPGELAQDLQTHPIRAGKSEVEFAFYLRPIQALFFGDVVRSHVSGSLMLLPDPKLNDRAQVVRSLKPLSELPIRGLLLGDGDSIFNAAEATFASFLAQLTP